MSLLVCIPHNRGRRQGVSLGAELGRVGYGGGIFYEGGQSLNSSGKCTIIRTETLGIETNTVGDVFLGRGGGYQ